MRTNNYLWSKPLLGWYLKVNWDDAYNREVERLAFGAIIRDDKCIVVGIMRASKNFNSNPLVA